MPKLAAKVRKKVEKAKAVSGGFEPMPAGKYVATLSEVEATTSAAGNPMWKTVWTDLTNLDGEEFPGRQWYNLMLPQDTMPEDYRPGPSSKKSPEDAWEAYQALCEGRLKAFFEAFEMTIDSDTDEMIGERAVLQVGIRTIQKGAKAGELTNDVNNVLPLDSVDFEDDGGTKKDEDNF
jgi:hypothetical protein